MKEYNDLNDYELMYMVSENDEYAKDLMYDKYKPLIVNMACKYYQIGKRMGLEIDDFIQEGYYGLFKALSNFSESKDCLFYTYALKSINSKMYNLCTRNDNKKNQVLNNSISLNRNLNNDTETSLIDMIQDKNSPNPWDNIDNTELYRVLKENIYGRPLMEGAILELKLNGFNNASISILLDRSRTYLDKIITNLKRELRNNLRSI